MKIFLLVFLVCLVYGAEKPLPLSGKFNTIYLAGKYEWTTRENSQFRMLMREVKYFNQYRVMSMTFYVRKNMKCESHTVWADKVLSNYCSVTGNIFLRKCAKRNGTDLITGIWKLRDAMRHFPNIYIYPETEGGLYRSPSGFYIIMHFVSNTTILFEAQFLDAVNIFQILTGELATGTNITEEMQEEYMKLTQELGIPNENIENVYETDSCPK